jgi:hypothetical protein
MAYRARPRFEAETLRQHDSSFQRATEVLDRPREAQQRAASRRPRWNAAPVLEPLVELYRRRERERDA